MSLYYPNAVANAKEHVKIARKAAKNKPDEKYRAVIYRDGKKHMVIFKAKKCDFKKALKRISKYFPNNIMTLGTILNN